MTPPISGWRNTSRSSAELSALDGRHDGAEAISEMAEDWRGMVGRCSRNNQGRQVSPYRRWLGTVSFEDNKGYRVVPLVGEGKIGVLDAKPFQMFARQFHSVRTADDPASSWPMPIPASVSGART